MLLINFNFKIGMQLVDKIIPDTVTEMAENGQYNLFSRG